MELSKNQQYIIGAVFVFLLLGGAIGLTIRTPKIKLTPAEQRRQQQQKVQFVGGINPYLGEEQEQGTPAFVGILVVLVIASIFGTIMAFAKKQSEPLFGYAQQAPFLRRGVFQ
jgi:hypothetical protein